MSDSKSETGGLLVEARLLVDLEQRLAVLALQHERSAARVKELEDGLQKMLEARSAELEARRQKNHARLAENEKGLVEKAPPLPVSYGVAGVVGVAGSAQFLRDGVPGPHPLAATLEAAKPACPDCGTTGYLGKHFLHDQGCPRKGENETPPRSSEHANIGAGGGDEEGFIHPDVLASQSPELQAEYAKRARQAEYAKRAREAKPDRGLWLTYDHEQDASSPEAGPVGDVKAAALAVIEAWEEKGFAFGGPAGHDAMVTLIASRLWGLRPTTAADLRTDNPGRDWKAIAEALLLANDVGESVAAIRERFNLQPTPQTKTALPPCPKCGVCGASSVETCAAEEP